VNQCSVTELHILAQLHAGKTLREIAAQLGLQEPAVSRALKGAERKAGLNLTERRGRRIFLTSCGAELAARAGDVTSRMDAFEERLREMQARRRGTLRVVATRAVADYILPPILTAFFDASPQIELDLVTVPRRQLLQEFLDESYDVAVGPLPEAAPSLAKELLYCDQLVVFAPAGSPLLHGRRYDWPELQALTLLMAPFDDISWEHAVTDWERRGVSLPRVRHLHTAEGVKQMVHAGAGLGVLFRSALLRDLAEGRFFEIAVSGLSIGVPYWVIRRQGHQDTAVVDAFCTFVLRGAEGLLDAEIVTGRA